MNDSALKQIERFFTHYKDLEPGKWVKISESGDKEVAKRLISEGIKREARKRTV